MAYNKFSFLDSTITEIEKVNKDIIINIEDVLSPNKELVRGVLKIINVKNIYLDGNLVDEILMYYQDGEIIHLEINKDVLDLIVIWNNFDTKDMRTIAYQLNAKKFDWQPKNK